jgi:CRP-like cAMP-binding protein
MIEPVARMLFLRSIPVLGDLPQEILATFAEHLIEVPHDRGAVLQSAGRPVDGVHIVVEGEAELRFENAAPRTITTGAAIGFLESLAGQSTATVVARTPLLALELHIDALVRILEENFTVVLHALRGTGRLLLAELMNGVRSDRLTLPMVPDWNPSAHPDRVERMLLLSRTLIFSRVEVEALGVLSRVCREVEFAAGERLWAAGEHASWIGVLLSGSTEGRRDGTTILHMQAGAVAGFLESAGDLPRPVEMVAVEPISLLRIEISDLIDVMEDDFRVSLEVLGAYSSVVLEIYRRVSQLPTREAIEAGGASGTMRSGPALATAVASS